MDKDLAERESRDKETKILNLARQLEEMKDRLAETERLRQQQAQELSDLISSKDDAGKSVSWTEISLLILLQSEIDICTCDGIWRQNY